MLEQNQRQLSKHEKKLKEENQALRSEVKELKAQISRLAKKIEGRKWPPAAPEGLLSPEKKKSVQYLSDKYDDSKTKTMDELRLVFTRLEAIENKCQEMMASTEIFEGYSYKNNLKIVGVPVLAERKTAEQTALLCLRLFSALGVKDRASNKPNAIVCKFTRRLAKYKVMGARRRVSSLQAKDLGFEENVHASRGHSAVWPSLTATPDTAVRSQKVQEWERFQVLLGYGRLCTPTQDGFLKRHQARPYRWSTRACTRWDGRSKRGWR